jgi:hypothetical protein
MMMQHSQKIYMTMSMSDSVTVEGPGTWWLVGIVTQCECDATD